MQNLVKTKIKWGILKTFRAKMVSTLSKISIILVMHELLSANSFISGKYTILSFATAYRIHQVGLLYHIVYCDSYLFTT